MCFTIVISFSRPSAFLLVFVWATVSALPGCPASLFYVICVLVLVCFKANYNTYIHTTEMGTRVTVTTIIVGYFKIVTLAYLAKSVKQIFGKNCAYGRLLCLSLV